MTDYEKNTSPKTYIIALIDVLGQKTLLEKHRYLTETVEGRASLTTARGLAEFRRVQDDTYNRVLELRRVFEKALMEFQKKTVDSRHKNKLSPEDQAKIDDIAKPMSYQFFSDTIIIYAPLESRDEVKMRYRIAATFFACMGTMFISFGRGTFFRGGVEIGIGTEFPKKGGIYGLALNDAYYLENEVANYPRIVVGKKLVGLVQGKERKASYNKFFTGLNNRLDGFCNSSIAKDKDGNYIVDFLGRLFADICMNTPGRKNEEYICEGVKSIADQYNRYFNKDQKLSQRYELLKDYYFERLENWGLQQSTIKLKDA